MVNKDVSFCTCYPFPEEWGLEYARGIVMGRFLIFYAIPLSIITLFYIMIAKHLMYSANHVPGEIQGAVRQVSKRLRRCSLEIPWNEQARRVLTIPVCMKRCIFQRNNLI